MRLKPSNCLFLLQRNRVQCPVPTQHSSQLPIAPAPEDKIHSLASVGNCTHMHTHTRTYTCTYTCSCMHTHTHIHMHKHMHAHLLKLQELEVASLPVPALGPLPFLFHPSTSLPVFGNAPPLTLSQISRTS